MIPTLRMRWGEAATFTAMPGARRCHVVFSTALLGGGEARREVAVVNGEFTITAELSRLMPNRLPPAQSFKARVEWGNDKVQSLFVTGSTDGPQ